MFANNVADAAAAVATVRKAIVSSSVRPLRDRLALQLRLAGLLRTAVKDEAAAEREYRAVLNTGVVMLADPALAPLSPVDPALKELIAILRAGARTSDFVFVATNVLAADAVPIASITQLADASIALAKADTQQPLVEAFRRCAARRIADPMACDACAVAIARLTTLQPARSTEAIQEARVCFRTCQPTRLSEAAELVAMAFKAADRNLSRANAFLKFQKFGPLGEDGKPGTADDLVDPLAAVPPIPPGAGRNQPFEAALAGLGEDVPAMRARGRLLLMMDRNAEAFDALVRAFELCPARDADLQAITDELTALVVRATRDMQLAQRVVDYIMAGTAGADGRNGTDDDPGDAFGEVRRRLSGGTAVAQTAP